MPSNILDTFVRKTADITEIPENIVDKVTAHQWKSSHENLYKESSVEISGIGTYRIRVKLTERKIGRLQDFVSRCHTELLTEEDQKKREKTEEKIKRAEEEIRYLQTKL